MNQNFDYDSIKNMSCGNFIEYLLSLSANELALLATGIGFLLSSNINTNRQNSLGNFFELIGQLLLTLAAQNAVLEENPSRQQLQQEINLLRQEINNIKKANL